MKTLYELVEQYKSDVEQRIKCIKDEWDNADDSVHISEDCIDDYDQQIAHWETTLKEIDDVLWSIPEQTNEMRVLQELVEEFSPIHQGQTTDYTYDELFDIVAEIVKTHNEE